GRWGAIGVWDAHSGTELLRLRGHESRVWSVAFSPDGRRIVSGSADQTVRVWDASSGAELLCLRGHESEVVRVVFSPDGRRIVSGSADQTVRVWDASSEAQLLHLHGHDSKIRTVVFSSRGRRIVSRASFDDTCVWDADSGKRLLARSRRLVSVVSSIPAVIGVIVFMLPTCCCLPLDIPWLFSSSDGGTRRLVEMAYLALILLLGLWYFSPVFLVFEIPTRAPREPPRQLRLQGWETAIEARAGGETVAWFPLALDSSNTAVHPSG